MRIPEVDRQKSIVVACASVPVTPRPSSSGPFLTLALSCMSSDEMGLTRRVETAQSDSTSGDESSVLIGAVSAADSPWDKRGAPGGKRRVRIALMALVIFVIGGALLYSRSSGGAHLRHRNDLRVVTWNVAAVNNNPFEYWVTHNDAAYNRLMDDVQRFISDPAERDVEVGSVFTHAMWLELREAMAAAGMGGLDGVEQVWKDDFSKRRIISGFLKDKGIGEKRLASMPDRVTNTINLADGTVANRPTVINCFAGAMGTTERWWREWKRFMFHTHLSLPGAKKATPASMLQTIRRAKYPAITEAEEQISIPLQTLAQASLPRPASSPPPPPALALLHPSPTFSTLLRPSQAIFDATLVHVVNSVSPSAKWQTLQQDMCDALNRRKDERTFAILRSAYADADALMLQETAASFSSKALASPLGSSYNIVTSSTADGKRDQNSVLLLSKARFDVSTLAEHTAAVMSRFDKSVPVAPGDLLVASVADKDGTRFLFASFHGDTNGLATVRVLAAVDDFAKSMPEYRREPRASPASPALSRPRPDPRRRLAGSSSVSTPTRTWWRRRDGRRASPSSPPPSSREATPHAGATRPTPDRTPPSTRAPTCRRSCRRRRGLTRRSPRETRTRRTFSSSAAKPSSCSPPRRTTRARDVTLRIWSSRRSASPRTMASSPPL